MLSCFADVETADVSIRIGRGPLPWLETDEDIIEPDDDGVPWVAAWAHLGYWDLSSQDKSWRQAAERIFDRPDLVFFGNPVVLDDDGETLDDRDISGDPDQRAQVSCWLRLG